MKVKHIFSLGLWLALLLIFGTGCSEEETFSMKRNDSIRVITNSTMVFSLEGEGTAASPYLISDADDFDAFIYGLYQDSLSHGKGLYFAQTGDFTAPPLSDVYTGRNYAAFTFAGTYDGRGHTLALDYTGADTEDNVGLFKILYDSVKICRLNIEARMRGINQCGGIIAGRAEGNVTLDSITVNGYVTGADNIGGLIGYNRGNLTVKNSRFFATVNGTSNVGGLVGLHEKGLLSVDGCTNMQADRDNGVLSIIATGENVGGIAGTVNSGSVSLANIKLNHSVSQADIGIKVIYSQNGNSGGLFGKLAVSSDATISNVQVVASVRSDGSNVGGLIGYWTSDKQLSIANTKFHSYLRGCERVGGFIGRAVGGKVYVSNIQIAQSSNGGYLSIEADKSVGGLIGNAACGIEADGTNTINAPVVAYEQTAGGVIGLLENSTLEVNKFSLSANTRVYGGAEVGGIVGRATGSTVKGSHSVSFNSGLPSASSFASNFAGTVSSGSPAGGATTAGTSMGGIVGYAYNTSVTGVCFTGSVYGSERVGGIVGQADLYTEGSDIKNCVGNGSVVDNNAGSATGGIIGRLNYKGGNIEYLINYASITGADETGGIIGKAEIDKSAAKMKLKYLVNVAAVSGKNNVGGCVGTIGGNEANGNEIACSANYGTVTNGGGGSLGGILGYGNIAKSAIFSCANHGEIHGGSSGATNVGGICGRFGWHSSSSVSKKNNTELAYCCNTATIASDHEDSYIGGVLGRQSLGHSHDETHWMVHDCYNKGAVTTDHNRDTGGLVGYVDHYSEVRYCVNTGNVAHGNGVVGTRKESCIWYHHNLYFLEGTGKDWNCSKFKAADKGKQSTYGGFDFSGTWLLDDAKNQGYPYLKDCPFQFVSR